MNKLFSIGFRRTLKFLNTEEITTRNVDAIMKDHNVRKVGAFIYYRMPRTETKQFIKVPCPIQKYLHSNTALIVLRAKNWFLVPRASEPALVLMRKRSAVVVLLKINASKHKSWGKKTTSMQSKIYYFLVRLCITMWTHNKFNIKCGNQVIKSWTLSWQSSRIYLRMPKILSSLRPYGSGISKIRKWKWKNRFNPLSIKRQRRNTKIGLWNRKD